MMTAFLILLFWVIIFAIWHYFIKKPLGQILRENAVINATIKGFPLSFDVLKEPEHQEFAVGVVGIILFFFIGMLLA